MNNTSGAGNRFLIIVALAIVTSLATFALKIRYDQKFESAKEITTGIIKKVVHDVHKSEYAYYERYLVNYEYYVENQLLSKVFECKPREISVYFVDQPQKGDSILVAYNNLQPLESKPIINTE